MIQTFLAILQFIGFYSIGAACFFTLFPKKRTSITEALAYSFGIGVAIYMIILSMGVLARQFTLTYFLMYFLIAVSLYINWQNRKSIQAIVTTIQEKVFLFFTALFTFGSSIIAFAFPLLGNDARAMWLIKGKVIAQGAAAFYSYILPEGALPLYGHQDYPIGLSSIYAVFYTIIPKYAEPFIGVFALLFFVSLVMLFAAALIKRLPKISTFYYLICIGLVFFASMYITQGWSAYADVPLSLFFAYVVYGLLVFEKENAQNWVLLILLCATGGALIKNEGLTYLVASVLAITPLVFQYIKKKSYLNIVIALLLFICPILSWMYIKSKYDVTNDIVSTSQSGRTILFYIGRIPDILKQTLIRLLNGYLFGALWVPALIAWSATILETIKTKKFESLLPSMLVLFQATVYAGIYFITPHEIVWHISTSFTRLVLHLLPSIYLIVVLQFSYLSNNKL